MFSKQNIFYLSHDYLFHFVVYWILSRVRNHIQKSVYKKHLFFVILKSKETHLRMYLKNPQNLTNKKWNNRSIRKNVTLLTFFIFHCTVTNYILSMVEDLTCYCPYYFFFKLTTILTNSFYCNIELELARNERLDTNSFLKKNINFKVYLLAWIECHYRKTMFSLLERMLNITILELIWFKKTYWMWDNLFNRTNNK